MREALTDLTSGFEEGKADVLGLYMVDALANKGELDKTKLMDNYVTFLAGILRSVRFGATDAHAKANMLRFNFFADHGAFALDPRVRALALPDTLICRCEDVPLHALDGYADARSAKLASRCGMGACQGRICGTALAELGRFPRSGPHPPLFPARLSTLGDNLSSS